MNTTTRVSGFLRCHHCNVHYCHKTAALGWTLGLCHWIRIWLHQVDILLVLSEIEAVSRTAIEPLIRVHSIHTDRQPPTTGDTDLWRSCWCRTCLLVSFKSNLTSVVQKSSLYTRGGTVHVFVPNCHGMDLSVRCMRPYDEYRQFTLNPEGGAQSNATLFDNCQQKNSECRELRTWKQSPLETVSDHVRILTRLSHGLTKDCALNCLWNGALC